MKLSVRTRILVWILLLIAVATTVSTLVTRAILHAGLTNRVDRELAQEVGKFRTFAAASNDTNVDALLADYLRQKSPDANETLFSVVDGAAARRVAVDPPAHPDRDPAFVARIAGATKPSYGWADSTAGRVRFAAVPVRVAGDSRPAALAVVEFYDLEAHEITATVRVLALVGVGAVVLVGAVGWLVAGRALAPLRQLRETAGAISGDEMTDRLEIRGDDDLAQLGRTFNRMLDRIEHAFSTQRQFLDDVGHELRTPITVIRGHLDLMGDDPAERAETIALVRDELERMNRIVQDLLLLARADQPDFVQFGEVELADLTVQVIAKSRGIADRRWEIDELAERVVLADRQRITQALLQLTANAVAHTQRGDVVAVGSAVREGRVLLWVRDTGVGLPSGDPARLFERAMRGDAGVGAAGDRAQGTGLGLAIVASIVQAHGGGVTASGSPGGGATFTVSLPLRAVDDIDAAVPASPTVGVPE